MKNIITREIWFRKPASIRERLEKAAQMCAGTENFEIRTPI